MLVSCGMHWLCFCLVAVMADNGRLPDAFKAYNLFTTLMEAHRGEVRATVTAAEVIISAAVFLYSALCVARVSNNAENESKTCH